MKKTTKAKTANTSNTAKTADSEKFGVTVRYSTTCPDRHPQVYAYALKVEVTKAVGMTDHLFVFQRSPENNEGDCVDTFIQIASPLEVEEVPEDAPDPMHGMPYYRAKEVTLWFRTMEDVVLAKKKFDDDLMTLTTTYHVLNGAPDKEETRTYG